MSDKKAEVVKICPNCKSRATKLYNMNTGEYTCQVCRCVYVWQSYPPVKKND